MTSSFNTSRADFDCRQLAESFHKIKNKIRIAKFHVHIGDEFAKCIENEYKQTYV